MTPGGMVSLALCVTAGAALAGKLARDRRRSVLRRLATTWRMNYSPFDPLHLTPRVAQNFPIPGAAHVRVSDVIYGIESDRYRYIFTAEFTVGVVRTKRLLVRAATFTEPRDMRGGQKPGQLELAPAHLPLIKQYQRLAPAGSQAN